MTEPPFFFIFASWDEDILPAFALIHRFRRMSLRKNLVSGSFIAAFLAYVFVSSARTSALPALPPPSAVAMNVQAPTATPTVPPASAPSASSTPPPASPTRTPSAEQAPAPAAPRAQPRGRYKDGTYAGVSADAYYGTVQVAAVISGGRLADVRILDYPQDRGTSRMINQQAMPTLVQEALTAQSAHVDGVSGATDSSGAFRTSLASALAQAGA